MQYFMGKIPSARFYFSSYLPRAECKEVGKEFTLIQSQSYNRLTKRAAQQARSLGIPTIVVAGLLLYSRKCIANGQFFTTKDGLHLNCDGRKMLAQAWMTACSAHGPGAVPSNTKLE